MHPVGFEPTISAGERPQTYVLDRAATGTGVEVKYWNKLKVNSASCWYLLYGCITMYGQQNIKDSLSFILEVGN
jgi:hypothetical protein